MPFWANKKKAKRKLTKLDVQEVSICPNPANQKSWVGIIKMADEEPSQEGGQNMPENENKPQETGTLEERMTKLQKDFDELKASKEASDQEAAKLREELTAKSQLESLTEDERKFFDSLGDEGKKTFQKASHDEREMIMEKDQYVVGSGGKIIHKSNTDPDVFNLIKAVQEDAVKSAAAVAQLRKEKEEADIRKHLTDEYGELPKEDGDTIVKMYHDADEASRKVLGQLLAQVTKGQETIDKMTTGWAGPASSPEARDQSLENTRELIKQRFGSAQPAQAAN